jgi:hypothetical protein
MYVKLICHKSKQYVRSKICNRFQEKSRVRRKQLCIHTYRCTYYYLAYSSSELLSVRLHQVLYTDLLNILLYLISLEYLSLQQSRHTSLTLFTLSTFHVDGNWSARRKPVTFGRALNSFHPIPKRESNPRSY